MLVKAGLLLIKIYSYRKQEIPGSCNRLLQLRLYLIRDGRLLILILFESQIVSFSEFLY